MSNHITITGKVGQDPELRYTPGGMAILNFSVADTYGKDEKKKTTWHDITVFNKLAENVANTIGKGSTVIIVGRYEQEEFTKKDGTKGKGFKIIADEVGASCRWNAWVQDNSGAVMQQVGQVFPSAREVLVDEEPF
jgi:single-strand DNA-binding protein